MNLATADWLVVGLYLVFLTGLGIWSSRKNQDEESFLLAGRTVTLPGFVVTLVTTWYGGILGVGEFSYLHGLSNWLVFGFPYYVFAFIFAFWLAPKINESRLVTIPDQLEKAYGRPSGIIGAILTFFMVTPAPYALMSGLLVSMVTPLPLWVAILLSLVFSNLWIWFGGYRSLVITDFLQFAMMYAGFMVVAVIAWDKLGGWEYLSSHLPVSHLEWIPDGQEWNMVVWFFIASMTLVDPGFYQRCYSAKSAKTAKNGILISIGFWLIFDFLTTLTGLYARAVSSMVQPPANAYPFLGEILLPPFLKGLFFTGMLATVWSTLNGFSFLSAQTLGRDLVARVMNDNENQVLYTRVALIFVSIFALTIAALSPTIVDIWFTLGSVVLPGLLIPVLAIHLKIPIRFPNRIPITMVATLITGIAWTWGLPELDGLPSWVVNVSAFYPGMLVVCVGMISAISPGWKSGTKNN